MNGDLVQDRIYKGYGKTAAVLGCQYNHYRASSPNNPVSVQNRIGTFHVALNAEDMKFSKPNKYGKATWYALFDARTSKPGDYLVGEGRTFFIAAKQPLLPIMVVECTRTITVSTPQPQSGAGMLPYGGTTEASEVPFLTGWPCSILQGTKGEKTDAKLPGDARAPWWVVLLPAYTGATISFGDIISDDLGRRYIISSAELTDLGWRLTAVEAVS